jgi:hypothetical protein
MLLILFGGAVLHLVYRDGARKFYGKGPANKKFHFFRIFLLKKIIFVVF